MVKWKVIKYKHQKKAQELSQLNESGKLSPDEATEFIVSLVADWDFKDAETGEEIPVGEYDELTLEQYEDLVSQFNDTMAGISVPKTNAEPSRSGSTRSRAKRK